MDIKMRKDVIIQKLTSFLKTLQLGNPGLFVSEQDPEDCI